MTRYTSPPPPPLRDPHAPRSEPLFPNPPPVPLPVKTPDQSKVFLFNLIAGLAEAAQMALDAHVLPPGVITLVVCGANIVLRRFTRGPMVFFKEE